MEAEGKFGGKVQPKTIEEWNRREPNHQIVRKDRYKLMQYGVFILAGLVLIMAYAVLNDSFKSNVTQTCPEIPQCPACPVVNIPSCPSNNFSCPSVNLSCPTMNCNFPSSLNINVSDQS